MNLVLSQNPILSLDVVPNVWLTRIVPEIMSVNNRNVAQDLTHVTQVPVDREQFVPWDLAETQFVGKYYQKRF